MKKTLENLTRFNRWEARLGHRAALKRITRNHKEYKHIDATGTSSSSSSKGSGGGGGTTGARTDSVSLLEAAATPPLSSAFAGTTMSIDDVMKLIHQDVVCDQTYVPREDGRPLFPAS